MNETVGFTGTRKGMTVQQSAMVRAWLDEHQFVAAVHGDCLGADAQFHAAAVSRNIPLIRIRPGCDQHGNMPTRAWCSVSALYAGAVRCDVLPPERYLVRDRRIVADATILLATPNTYVERLRSGTWTTIREARRVGVPVHIIFPNGSSTLPEETP